MKAVAVAKERNESSVCFAQLLCIKAGMVHKLQKVGS